MLAKGLDNPKNARAYLKIMDSIADDARKFEQQLGKVGKEDILSNYFKEINAQIATARVQMAELKNEISHTPRAQNLLKAVQSGFGTQASKNLSTAINSGDIENMRIQYERLRKVVEKSSGSEREGLRKTLQSLNLYINNFPVDRINEIQKRIEALQQEKALAGQSEEAQAIVQAFTSATGVMNGFANSTRDNSNAQKEFTNNLIGTEQELENLKQRLVYFFGLENMIRVIKGLLRDTFNTIKELDSAMAETAVVTDMTISQLWDKLPEYTAMANQFGTSILGVYKASTLYYQQGLKTEAVMEVTAETLKMARIAGLDYEEATNAMTAALRGFNMEVNEASAQRVNDVYSKLAAITASDVQEISTAMTKTASLAHNANMEFETTAAFLSQIIETTRESAETAGTAMKTVIARFTELKKNPAELVEVDGETVDANKIEAALRTIDVPLRDVNGQFRELDDVFLDIASKWDGLSVNTQRYIATIAAGSRQQSRFIAMMSNYEHTMELVTAAQNAAGASVEQFDKVTESVEYKLQQLDNSWNEFLLSLTNNDAIKTLVDILKTVLDILNGIGKVFGGGFAGSIARIVAIIAGFKVGGALLMPLMNRFVTAFKQMGTKSGQSFLEGFQTSIRAKGGAAYKEYGAAGATKLKGMWNNVLYGFGSKRFNSDTWYQDSGMIRGYFKNDAEAFSRLYYNPAEQQAAIKRFQTGAFNEADWMRVQAKGALDPKLTENLDTAKISAAQQKIQGLTTAAFGCAVGLSAIASGLNAIGEATDNEGLKNAGSVLSSIATGLMVVIPLLQLLPVAMGPVVLAIGAAIGLLIGLVKLMDLRTPAEKMKDALKAVSDELGEVNSKLKSLESGKETIESLQKTIESNAKGTKAWSDAVQQLTDKYTELKKQYPELQMELDKYGNYVITNLDEEITKAKTRQEFLNVITSTGELKSKTSIEADKEFSAIALTGDYQGKYRIYDPDTGGLVIVDSQGNIYGEGTNGPIDTGTKLGKSLSQWVSKFNQSIQQKNEIDYYTQVGAGLQKILAAKSIDITKSQARYIANASASLGDLSLSDLQDIFDDYDLEVTKDNQYLYQNIGKAIKYYQENSNNLAKEYQEFLNHTEIKFSEWKVGLGVATTPAGKIAMDYDLTVDQFEKLLDLDPNKIAETGKLLQQTTLAIGEQKNLFSAFSATDFTDWADIEKLASQVQAQMHSEGKSEADIKNIIDGIYKLGDTFGASWKDSAKVLKDAQELDKAIQAVREAEEDTILSDDVLTTLKSLGGVYTQSRLVGGRVQNREELLKELEKFQSDRFKQQVQGLRDSLFKKGELTNFLIAGPFKNLVDVWNEVYTDKFAESAKEALRYYLKQMQFSDTQIDDLVKNVDSFDEGIWNKLTEISNIVVKAATAWSHNFDLLYNQNTALDALSREMTKLQDAWVLGTIDSVEAASDNLGQQLGNLEAQREVLLKKQKNAKAAIDNYFANAGIASDALIYDRNTGYYALDWGKIQNLETDATNGQLLEWLEEGATKYIDELNDIPKELRDLEKAANNIRKEIVSARIEVNQKLAESLEKLDREAEEKAYEAQTKLLEQIKETQTNRKQLRDDQKSQQSLLDKERRLLYLQQDTTGSNQLEIMQLQQELEDERQNYTDTLIERGLSDIEKEMNENHQHRLDQIENWKEAGDYYRAAEKMWQEATTKGLSLQSEPIVAIMKAQGFLDKDQVDQLFRDIAAQAYQAYADPITKTTKAFETAIGGQSNEKSGAVWELGQLSLYAKNAADKLALLPSIIDEVMDKISKTANYNIDEILEALYFKTPRPQYFWTDSKLPFLESGLRKLDQSQLNNVYNTINLSAGQWTIDELLNYITRIINPANTSIK